MDSLDRLLATIAIIAISKVYISDLDKCVSNRIIGELES